MIITVTPNPALDLTYHLTEFRIGASHRVPPATVRAGGKGLNVARVLHEQGLPTRALAPVGGSSGRTFGDLLNTDGLPHELIEVGAATRQTLAIVAGETTNLNESGHAFTGSEWERVIETVTANLAAATVLTYSGSHPPDTPTWVVTRVIAAAKAAGVPIIVDTSADHLAAAADAGADILKPNDNEALAVIGGTDPLDAGRELARRCGGLVLLSLGAEGIAAIRSDGPIVRARGRELSGNTTGAGDAAVAAAASVLHEATHNTTARKPTMLDDALRGEVLRRAVAWSGAAVLAPLAGSIVDPAPLYPAITVSEF